VGRTSLGGNAGRLRRHLFQRALSRSLAEKREDLTGRPRAKCATCACTAAKRKARPGPVAACTLLRQRTAAPYLSALQRPLVLS